MRLFKRQIEMHKYPQIQFSIRHRNLHIITYMLRYLLFLQKDIYLIFLLVLNTRTCDTFNHYLSSIKYQLYFEIYCLNYRYTYIILYPILLVQLVLKQCFFINIYDILINGSNLANFNVLYIIRLIIQFIYKIKKTANFVQNKRG